MQYFKPEGNLFVGDCMPFFDNGIFRLFYLVDENHHQALGGLGGHQWAHASSSDLLNWTHHPIAIAITDDLEGSICTGSIFYENGKYYAFYATRLRDWKQHVSLAVSDDGINFTKTNPKLLISPPSGYHPCHFRDPIVFKEKETGIYHMLVTAENERHPIAGRGGCLAHLTSNDLNNWEVQEPFIIPGFPDVPECPDYFCWNGWYYLIFSNGGKARYRISRNPLGPWTKPANDLLDGGASCVMKTAAFTGNRRIGISWIGTRIDEKDYGHHQFGGYTVFRELVQYKDGTLGTKFVDEFNKYGKEIIPESAVSLTPDSECNTNCIVFDETNGLGAVMMTNIPENFKLNAAFCYKNGNGVYGLRVRGEDNINSGYDICFDHINKTVKLHTNTINQVNNLNKIVKVELIVKDSIIDLSINNCRCIIDYCPEQKGNKLWFYGWDVNMVINLSITEIG